MSAFGLERSVMVKVGPLDVVGTDVDCSFYLYIQTVELALEFFLCTG